MAQVRLLATNEKYRKAPYYFTPRENPNKRGSYVTAQDLDWKQVEENNLKKFVLATKDDETKAKELSLVIDPGQSYMVKDKMVFNLDNKADQVLLNFFKTYDQLIATKKSDIVPGRHRYYIEDLDEEAKDTITQAEQEYSAMTEIKKMGLEQMQNFARVLSIGKVDNLSKTQVEASLFEMAKKSPAVVLSTLGDPNMKVKAFIKKLTEKNIIRFFNGKYMYGNEILGLNEQAVVDYMKLPGNQNMVSEFGKLLEGHKKEQVAA